MLSSSKVQPKKKNFGHDFFPQGNTTIRDLVTHLFPILFDACPLGIGLLQTSREYSVHFRIN